MLRFRYMPSDYHPLILILGSGDDLRKLATLLRSFAKDEAEVRLESLDFCAPGKTKLLLTTRATSQGVRPEADDGEHFLWILDAETADEFAFAIDSITSNGQLSGSEVLECEQPGEIPVKVSHGEYMDEFLLPSSSLPA
jgi:hypothetical protein